MKIKVTMEYGLDGRDVAEEQKDWIEGKVTFQDVWYLFDQGDESYKVKFETMDDEPSHIPHGWPRLG